MQASVAIVKDGTIAYLQAYGDARLEPKTPARAEMRYSIGSISKQFTAAAILLLNADKPNARDQADDFLLATKETAAESRTGLGH
jgi:hypothetical protein